MLIVRDVHGKIDQFWSICLDYWDNRFSPTQFICLAELETFEL